jgi:hypothetical protein
MGRYGFLNGFTERKQRRGGVVCAESLHQLGKATQLNVEIAVRGIRRALVCRPTDGYPRLRIGRDVAPF